MAALHRLLCCLIVSAFCIYSTSGQGQQWGDIAFSAEDLLNAIRKSHADYLAQSESSSRLDRRGAGFGRGRANYWRPLAPSQRPSSAEDFSDQLSQLLGVLGSSLEELIQLIASQFDIGDLQPGLDPSQSTVLPITVPYLTTRVGSATTTAPAVTSHDATTAATTRVISSPPHTTPVTTSSSLPPPAYTFNPQASNLNVVYYSQTDLTPIISLDRVCADDSIDIVIVAFVTALFSDGGYPAMNMASNCWAPNAAQQAAGATKLLDCVGDGFANQIARCQGRGKRVLLSLGGSVGDLHMESKEKAVEAAHLLWNLFLGGSEPELQPLRPYGNVVFDGIDIDNETPSNAIYLPTLAATLRQLFSSTSAKPYYLSAAPQCPRPDASIPVLKLLPYVDFFGVQFYNSPSCQLSSTDNGFFASLQAWSGDLLAIGASGGANVPTGAGSMRIRPKRNPLTTFTSPSSPSSHFININNGITAPRLLIGTPAFTGAGSSYVDVATYKSILDRVRDMALPNLAGAMFWDGAYQEVSGQVIDSGSGSGRNTTFAQVVKSVWG